MSVDPLSSLSAHLARLRTEHAEKSGKSRRKRAAEDRGDAAADTISDAFGNTGREAGSLREVVVEIVRNAHDQGGGNDDMLRSRIVKAILLWEFGASMREHPEWKPMIEKIVRAMDNDDRFSSAFSRMIDELKSDSKS